MIECVSMKQFTDNKYERWYWAIVDARREQPLSDDHYSEDHHIVPESFFVQRSREGPPGWLDGDPEHPNNRVRLTAREHFVCHWLLVKMTTGIAHIKMRDALEMMGVKAEHQHRYTSGITSRVFERNRIEVSKIRSERMMGDANPAKRPGVGEAIAVTKRGKKREPFSQEWIDNLKKSNSGSGNGMYGKKHGEETLKMLREKAAARRYSEETNDKRREASSGRKEITDGTVYKKVKGDELQYWLDRGWIVKGKPRKKSTTK